jgi:trimeric autotransporter adhesin
VTRRYICFISACVGLLAIAACHSATAPTATTTTTTGTTTTPTTPVVAQAVTIAGTTAFTAVGQTSQLTATTTGSDGSQQDVTSQSTWTSSNAAVATVSATGLMTAVSIGQCTITAVYQTVSGTATVTFPVSLTGVWGGTGSDSTGASSFTVVLTQSSANLGVSGTVTFVSNGMPGSGTFSGALSVYSPIVPFVISGTATSGSTTCNLTIRGYAQASSISITSAYTGTNSCIGPISNGQLTLVPQ